METDTNPYILKKSFRSFFAAAVLTSLISQIDRLSDGIILSHIICPEALSSIGLMSPIISIFLIPVSIICSGASLIAARMIGSQNYSSASRMLLISLCSILVVYAIICSGLYLLSDNIIHLITEDAKLLPFVEEYFPISILSMPLLGVGAALCCFVRISGRPRVVTVYAIIASVGNIVFNLLLVGVFKVGISGAGWASIISCVIGILYMLSYVKSRDCFYRIDLPDGLFVKSMMPKMVAYGLPSGLNVVMTNLMLIGVNETILKTTGTDGLFINTIAVQMIMISSLVLCGTSSAITGIGGILLGEKDLDGYRTLVTNILRKSFLAVFGTSVLFALFPDLIATLFGASDDLLERVRMPLRELSFYLAPYCIIQQLSASYVTLGRRLLASMICILQNVLFFLIIFIVCLLNPEYVWLSYSAGMWLIAGILLASTRILSFKNRNCHWMTLIPKYPTDPSVSRSVAYSEDGVRKMLADMRVFISICELSEDMTSKIKHCVEELSFNIINLASATGRKGCFDVRMVHLQDEILIVFKDDNRPYNPIYAFNPETGITPDEEKLGLIIVNSFCEDIKYAYLNGINCTYLKFHMFNDKKIPEYCH